MNLRYFLYLLCIAFPFLSYGFERGNAPLEFVRNDGQWEGNFLYRSNSPNSDIFLERNAINIVVGKSDNNDKLKRHHAGPSEVTLYYHRYRMVFAGANPMPEVTGIKPQKHYYNYFLGKDESKWKSFIHPNHAVDYHNLYANIDLHIASEDGRMKYDFIVQPGGDAAKIAMEYQGIEQLKIVKGKLQIPTSVGTVEELAPYAYQYVGGNKTEVKCRYKVTGNKLGYEFPDGYDRATTLVIDPTVVFATFSGSSYDNWGFTATYDASGNFYAGGITSSNQGGTGFNVTPGAFQVTYGTGSSSTGSKYPCDMSIAKYSANGNALVYATYMGGSDNEQPHSLVVDANNNLVICGKTYSSNYPVKSGSYDVSINGGADIVVTKLDAAGAALIGSTFLGGSGDDVVNFDAEEFTWGGLKHNYGDDARSEVILDAAGNVYIAACTKSNNFPVTGNAYQSSLGGSQDGVIVKMDPNLTSLTWSTYFGGSGDDAAYVLTLSKNESQLFVAGGTMSANFPITSGTYITTYRGSTDGFIARFQNGGNYPLQRSTFVGTSGYDQCYGIQINAQDEVYAMGQSLGGSFPVSSGAYSNANSSQFVIKLNNDLTTNIVSTVYGSGSSTTNNISPVAFLVDTCENVYISGWGGDIYTTSGSTPPAWTGTTHNMPLSVAPNAPAQATTDGKDFYFIVFSRNLASLVYATYQGGNGTVPEHVDGGTSRFDKGGVVYQAICGGCGASSAFPVTPGVFSPTNQSGNCNLIALKIAFNLGAVVAKAKAEPNAVICLGESINFNSAGTANATNYEWDFGDGGGVSTQASPKYTYTKAGVFQVRLIAINPNACKIRDTTFLTVTVDSNSIDANFTVTQSDSCEPFIAAITNTSRLGTPSSPSYLWMFGDGQTATSANPGTHQYADTGTYTITLVITDPNACNSPDTVSKTISFNKTFVKAKFDAPPAICEKTKASFVSQATNATSVLWKFGDGKTSTAFNPDHTYDTAGKYIITFYAYNPGTCNGVDSMTKEIDVATTPIANFTFAPIIPVTNEPIEFTNQSQRATAWIWDFGDNTFSQLETPRPKYFKRTGTYKVCLQALNSLGCSDTICKYVDADVYPLADIPKAFSPNGDGKNDILFVRGAAIEVIDLKIFNRWGEVVFQTTDAEQGWDGTYKGKEQPMEAYAYVLNVTFVDGTTFNKKGNVTLLR